jgi:hypothetical protein
VKHFLFELLLHGVECHCCLVLNSIVCGQQIPKSGIPESFKVLIRELQALGLDIKTYKLNRVKNSQIESIEVDLMKTYETRFGEYLFK